MSGLRRQRKAGYVLTGGFLTEQTGLMTKSHLFSAFCTVYMLNLLCRENKGDLYEQLNYEAIKEQAGMDDSELVYVSFSNQALAHLPYMVALDAASR